MIQVIIVDDEPLIRDGLRRLIDWGKFGMEVGAAFPNGAVALEYISREHVDLAIVDIKMPIMDGIRLMQECQAGNHPCRFIVLSGYSDFEYVKQAARLGIENFYPVKANAFLYVKSCGKQFDVIFSDAPYDLEGSERIVDSVLGGGLLRENGLFIFEHSRKMDFSSHGEFWQLRSYGSVQFSFFKKG